MQFRFLDNRQKERKRRDKITDNKNGHKDKNLYNLTEKMTCHGMATIPKIVEITLFAKRFDCYLKLNCLIATLEKFFKLISL